MITRQTGGPTVTSLLPKPASVIPLCKSINLTTEPGSSTILFIEQSREAKWAYWNNDHAHTTSDTHTQIHICTHTHRKKKTHKISLSLLWREQTHRWNFKHSLYFSSSDMLWKENKYHRRLQSTACLQCTKLISLCYLPKVFPLFISTVQPPKWSNMKENAEHSKDGFVFAIYVNLACFNRFTERSIPKLQGPRLSKMNNLIMITLNFLFCHNCLYNISLISPPASCQIDITEIKVALLVYFIVVTNKCLFNDFDLLLSTDFERRLVELLSMMSSCINIS